MLKKIVFASVLCVWSIALFAAPNEKFFKQYKRFHKVYVKETSASNYGRRKRSVRITYRFWKSIFLLKRSVYSHFKEQDIKNLQGREDKLYKGFETFRRIFHKDTLKIRESKRLRIVYISKRTWLHLLKFKKVLDEYFAPELKEEYEANKKPSE